MGETMRRKNDLRREASKINPKNISGGTLPRENRV
jgi:hypothetical protein